MKFNRSLKLAPLLTQKSHFLMGPRNTGKSTLIREQLEQTNQAVVINLLKSDLYRKLLEKPETLESILIPELKKTNHQWVVIDEIQRIPDLLNEVHRLIEEKNITFLLTGSSARALKKKGSNLLGGRARTTYLNSLTYHEIEKKLPLEKILLYGTLPSICTSNEPTLDLDAYCETYLREEISAEGFVRNLQPFSRFLRVAALSSGQQINFTKAGSDAEISPSTVREHFSILEDTLLGFKLPPWQSGKKRKVASTEKFYFFDTGVTNSLAGIQSLDRNSDLFGKRFEQFMIQEVRSYLQYCQIKANLQFWRTKHHDEVDLVIDDHTAIEFKCTKKITAEHIKPLKKIEEEAKFKNKYLVTFDENESEHDGINCLHWEKFIEHLWHGAAF